MECRENEMSRHGCLHRDGRTLEVTYLSDHDNIRILSKDSSESCRIRVFCFVVHFTLDDSWKFVFYRVFECNDFLIRGIQTLEHRIEGGGLSASSRSCDEHCPIFLSEGSIDLTFRCPLESEFFEFWYRCGRVEYSTDDIFHLVVWQ